MAIVNKSKEIEKLKTENARLKAALNETSMSCQRLEIVNSNLQIQLDEANRELEENIKALQEVKSDIDKLVNNFKESKKDE